MIASRQQEGTPGKEREGYGGDYFIEVSHLSYFLILPLYTSSILSIMALVMGPGQELPNVLPSMDVTGCILTRLPE